MYKCVFYSITCVHVLDLDAADVPMQGFIQRKSFRLIWPPLLRIMYIHIHYVHVHNSRNVNCVIHVHMYVQCSCYMCRSIECIIGCLLFSVCLATHMNILLFHWQSH